MPNDRNPASADLQAAFPPSVNFHLWKPCNMACRFCFATFAEPGEHPSGHLRAAEALAVVRHLSRMPGLEKMTFAGGEPTLCPWIDKLVRAAKSAGLVTMLVTNGSRLDAAEWILDPDRPLDWLTISIDSLDPRTNELAGRAVKGQAQNLDLLVEFVDRARDAGVRIKLNTVVHNLNWEEDLGQLVRRIQPERWKVFQVLPVAGQNDCEDLLIDATQFDAFVRRHRNDLPEGVDLVPETNDDITGTYAMVDPAGRFFDNTRGRLHYSQPILDLGVEAAWAQVAFSPEGFERRGGVYDWNNPLVPLRTTRRPRLIVFAGVSGAGKDTAAGFLLEEAWTRIAVADPLKHGLQAMLGLDDDQLWGKRRNESIDGLNVTPRFLFQAVSDVLRKLDPEVWLRRWARRITECLERGDSVVCTDVRTREELELAIQLGATTVLVTRTGSGAPGELAGHDTETALQGVQEAVFDSVLRNDGSLDELRQAVFGVAAKGR